MVRLACFAVACAVVGAGMAATAAATEEPLPAMLQQMIDTERAFARRTADIGVRDAFLEYFADDAVRLTAKPEPYKTYLRRLAPTPAAGLELAWEPRYGDIAASGELGYLTGPVTRIVHAEPPQSPTYNCYFSVWKRQADGSFKVFIDQGVSTPGPVPFEPGFQRAPSTHRFHGNPATSQATLAHADHALAAASAARAPADAYRPVLDHASKLYRETEMPMAGDAARRWLEARRGDRMDSEPLYAEAAAAGDLGVTYGQYRVSQAGQQREAGSYVRVWTRDDRGVWRISIDVLAPQAPKH